MKTQELFKSYPGLFPLALTQAGTPKPKTVRSADEKRRRQAQHVLERVRKEAGGRSTTSMKKTAAMLQSPFTASKPSNGVIYITFDENAAGQPLNAKSTDHQPLD